jgi:hypothetical protein
MKNIFVLNLPITMLNLIFSSLISLLLFSANFSNTSGVEIVSPTEGQIVQGNFQIMGSITAEDFQSAEISYAYADADSPNWFTIGTVSQPVTNSLLVVWDTTTISDGNYSLKLTVQHKDNSSTDFVVKKILVRNYTPVHFSSTPIVINQDTPVPSATPVQSIQATPYPKNEASLTLNSVNQGLVDGAVIGVICLAALGIYAVVHGWLRRR